MFIGSNINGEFRLDVAALLRHMACLGASGSGKTVACKVVCEEVIRKGLPVIAIDPQGDLASFALPPDTEGAVAKGISLAAVRDYCEKVEPVVYTPGSTAGIMLSANPFRPLDGSDEEQMRQRGLIAKSIASLLGYGGKQDVEAVLEIAVTRLYAQQEGSGFEGLAYLLDRYVDLFARYAAKPKLAKLARLLRAQTVGARRVLLSGERIDIDRMFDRSRRGRARLSVIYLNGLVTQEDKAFFVAVFAQELYRWMLRNPSPTLQGVFYVDEIAPFLPPVRQPACKDILRLVFKQARKYGVGCLIATQNPGDIDYTALSQFGTWGLGRLVSKQDRVKVAGAIKAIAPGADQVVASLAGSKVGEFMFLSPDQFDGVKQVYIRWLISAHRTLDESAIRELPIPLYAVT